jgi:hypothetical protein
MAFLVEDGYGLASANAYATVEFVDEYHTDRNNTSWPSVAASPASPDENLEAKQAAIVRASAIIDARYRAKFPGTRKNGRSQGLEWPRSDAEDTYDQVIPDTEVPIEVQQATAEAAIREYLSPGSLAPDFVSSQKVVSERVGALAVTYSDKQTTSGSEAVTPIISIIDGILAPIIGTSQQFLFGSSGRG